MSTFIEILSPVFLCILLAGTVLPLFSWFAERFLLKKTSASTKHRLWTLTAIGLLCFPIVVLIFRGGTSESTQEMSVIETEVSPIVAGNPESMPSLQSTAMPVVPVASTQPPVMETQTASLPVPATLPPKEIEKTPKESVSKYVLNTATVLWLVGVGLTALYFLAVHFRSTLFLSRMVLFLNYSKTNFGKPSLVK